MYRAVANPLVCKPGLQHTLSPQLPSGELCCDWQCQKLNWSCTGSPRGVKPPECVMPAGSICWSGSSSSCVWPYRVAAQLCPCYVPDFLADWPWRVTCFSPEHVTNICFMGVSHYKITGISSSSESLQVCKTKWYSSTCCCLAVRNLRGLRGS